MVINHVHFNNNLKLYNMQNTRKKLSGLDYRGNGFFLFIDKGEPRLTSINVAKRIGSHLGKNVTHICSNPYINGIHHVLQYTHLYEKDIAREKRRLEVKFNN